MFRLVALLAVGMALLIGPVNAKAPVPKSLKHIDLDAETIAAYERLGATYGRMTAGDYEHPRARAEEKPVDHGGVPAFYFQKIPAGKLPDANAAFGLSFQSYKITDEGLKDLKETSKPRVAPPRKYKSDGCGFEGYQGIKKPHFAQPRLYESDG